MPGKMMSQKPKRRRVNMAKLELDCAERGLQAAREYFLKCAENISAAWDEVKRAEVRLRNARATTRK
jgi:hypothetical protein